MTPSTKPLTDTPRPARSSQRPAGTAHKTLRKNTRKSTRKSTHKSIAKTPNTENSLHPLLAILLREGHSKAEPLLAAQTQALEHLPATGPLALAGLRSHFSQKKLVSPEAIQAATAELLGLEFLPHPEQTLDAEEFTPIIPIHYVKKFMFCPLAEKNGTLVITTEDPSHFSALQDAASRLGKRMRMVLSTRQSILALINSAYEKSRKEEDSSEWIDELIVSQGESLDWTLEEPEDLIDIRDEEPVKRLLNSMLYQAAQRNASDVHIDPTQHELTVRFRVDGNLQPIINLPKAVQRSLINRIKIISRLDIAQRSLPQDGRTLVIIAGRRIDIRVSVMPTVQGEKAVMRLLFQDQQLMSLPELGLPAALVKPVKRAADKSGGITLVSGPTGSGKTTSLYALLNTLDRQHRNIVTIEDPVEYKLAGYVQTEINSKAGLTFANALRSVLRQDPDVIMVGEMRDHETAVIATQAALTGHTVFSTVHTNNAPATITRLIDMGVEPYLVASTVNAVLAQRLVRKLCLHCREANPDAGLLLAELGVAPAKAQQIKTWHGKGCTHCDSSGYQGRLGVFELLWMNEHVKQVLLKNSSTDAVRQAAEAGGMKSMLAWGLELVAQGVTTPEELLHINRDD